METRRLGRLEHESTVLIYGGAALAEVTDEVADSAASAIFDQAENKLHTSMAVLDVLVTGALG